MERRRNLRDLTKEKEKNLKEFDVYDGWLVFF